MVACMNIILLLSLEPINAMRVMEAQKAVDAMSDSQDLMRELNRALEEDTMGVGEEEDSESQATCTDLKSDFEVKTQELRTRYETAKGEGKIGTYDAARIMLRARSATKALASAQTQACPWVLQKNVDKGPLEAMVADTKETNPCFGAAEAHLNAAKTSPAADQAAALTGAMGILLSKDCKPVKGATPVNDGAPSNATAEQEVVQLKAVPRPALTRAKGFRNPKRMGRGDALLQEEGFNSSEISALLNATKDIKDDATASAVDGALMEMVSQVHRDSVGLDWLDELIGGVFTVIGWICLAILWALFCWVMLAVFMLVLGLIACLIKQIIVGLLRLFWKKEDQVSLNYWGCVGFWLGALGHNNHATDISIGICAVSMMRR